MTTGNSARHPLSDAIFDADFIVPIPAAATPRNAPADDFYPPVNVFGSGAPTPHRVYVDPITGYESNCPGGLESISRRLAHTDTYALIQEEFAREFADTATDTVRGLRARTESVNAVMLWHATTRYIHWLRSRPDRISQAAATGVALRIYQNAALYVEEEAFIVRTMNSVSLRSAMQQLRTFFENYGQVAFCDVVRQLNNPTVQDAHWDYVTAYSVVPVAVTCITNSDVFRSLYNTICNTAVADAIRDRMLKSIMLLCTEQSLANWQRHRNDSAWELPYADGVSHLLTIPETTPVNRNLVVFDATPTPSPVHGPTVSVWPLIAYKQVGANQAEVISVGQTSEQHLVDAIIATPSWAHLIQLVSACPGITQLKQEFMLTIRSMVERADPVDEEFENLHGVHIALDECFHHPDIIDAELLIMVRRYNLTYTGRAYMAEQLWRRLRATGVLEEGRVMGALTDELPTPTAPLTLEEVQPMRTIGQPVDITNYPGSSAQPPTPTNVLFERGFMNLVRNGDLTPSWVIVCRMIAQATNTENMVRAVVDLLQGVLTFNRLIEYQFSRLDLLRLERLTLSPCIAEIRLAILRNRLSNTFITTQFRPMLSVDVQLHVPALRPLLAICESAEFQAAGDWLATVYSNCGRAVLDTLLLNVALLHRARCSQRVGQLPHLVLDQIFQPTNDVLACATYLHGTEQCHALQEALANVDHDLALAVLSALVPYAQGQWSDAYAIGNLDPYVDYGQRLSLQSQWCSVEEPVSPTSHTGPVFRLETERFLGWLEREQPMPTQCSHGDWVIVVTPTEHQVYLYNHWPDDVYTWQRHIPADWEYRRHEPIGYELLSWHKYEGARIYLQEGSGLPLYAHEDGRWDVMRAYLLRITDFRIRNDKLLWNYMGQTQPELQLPTGLLGRLQPPAGCVRTHVLDLLANWQEAVLQVPNVVQRTALITKLILWCIDRPVPVRNPTLDHPAAPIPDIDNLLRTVQSNATRVGVETQRRFIEMGGSSAQPPAPADVLLERGFMNLLQGDLAPSWTMLCHFIAQSTNFALMVEAVIQLFRGLLAENRATMAQLDYPDLLRFLRIVHSQCTAEVFLAVLRHGLSNAFIADQVRLRLTGDAQLQIPAVRPILASIESEEFQRAGRRMAAVYHTCGRAVLDALLLRVVWDHRAYRSQQQALPMQVLDQIFNPTNDVLACAAVMYDLEHCDALHNSLVEVDHDLVREVMGALVRFAQGQWNDDDIMGTTSPYTSYDQCLSLQSQWCAVFDEPVVLPAEHIGPVFRLDTEQFLGWIEPQQVFPTQGEHGNWFIVAMPTELQVYVYEELPNGAYTWRRHIQADWEYRRNEPLGYQLSSQHQYSGGRVYLREGSGLPAYAADGGRWEIIRTHVRRITDLRIRNGQLLWKYMGREQSPLKLPPMLISRLRAATGCVRTHILDLVENWSEAKQYVPNHAHRTALITKLCLWFQYQPDEGHQPQALNEGGLRHNIHVEARRLVDERRRRFIELGGAAVPASVGVRVTDETVTVASVEGLQAAWDATEPAPPQEGYHAFVDDDEVVMELDIYTLDRIAHRHVPNYDRVTYADQELLQLVAHKLNQSKDGQTPIEAMIASCIAELFNQQSATPAISHQRSLTLPRR